jgi:hypothetical protein
VNNPTKKGRGAAVQEGAQPKILWDDSNIFSVSADVAHVTGNREEFMLLFGERQAEPAGQEELKVDLKERVVMSPLAAKRLAIMLQRRIRDYESKYGPLEGEAFRTTQKKSIPALRQKPTDQPTERLPEKAEALFQLVKKLNLEVGYERSFKVSEKTLLENRFLLGFNKSSIAQNPGKRVLEICERMAMPDDFVEDFSEKLSEANYVHFGFEEDKNTSVYKAYLEFYEKVEEEIRNQPGRSDHFLLHLAFKWDATDNSNRVLTKYTWYPSLTVEGMLQRAAKILDPHKYEFTYGITKGILEVASRKIPHQDILYLEVTEEENPRSSFDINVYKANLQLKDLYPSLSKMCKHYSIPLERFQKLYDRVKTKAFGHLSGGISRIGVDFLTVYYGVEGYTWNHELQPD